MVVALEHSRRTRIGSHVHCGIVMAQQTRSRKIFMLSRDRPYVLNMGHEKVLSFYATCCSDKPPERQDSLHAEGQRSRPSKHDRGGLRPSDRGASGSGQWQRSGELDEQDWDGSRDHDAYQ